MKVVRVEKGSWGLPLVARGWMGMRDAFTIYIYMELVPILCYSVRDGFKCITLICRGSMFVPDTFHILTWLTHLNMGLNL